MEGSDPTRGERETSRARAAGALAGVGEADVLAALSLARRGRIYDLDCRRWHRMPVLAAHPPFQLLNAHSAAGFRNEGALERFLGGANLVRCGFNVETMIGTSHTGTHIDALAHVYHGPDARMHGGHSALEVVGDAGPLTGDASEIAPIVTRGVLVDVAGHLGVPALAAGRAISETVLSDALAAQRIDLRPLDAVLIRTGYMSVWPDTERTAEHFGAGIDHGAAVFLAEHGAVLAGADTEPFEVFPPADLDRPFPVHIELLARRGIHIMEMLDLEALAADRVHEFCFVCLPLAIRGATGSMTRPIAIV